MQLRPLGLKDPGLVAYLRVAGRPWPWVPAVVLPTLARRSGELLGLDHRGEVVGGALLTPHPTNRFLHRSERRLARDYCAAGYANLSYFAVRGDLRGQGLGRAFLQALAQERSFWLACDPDLAPFYQRAGLAPSALDPAFHHVGRGHGVDQ